MTPLGGAYSPSEVEALPILLPPPILNYCQGQLSPFWGISPIFLFLPVRIGGSAAYRYVAGVIIGALGKG